jgi:hypothetical protein
MTVDLEPKDKDEAALRSLAIAAAESAAAGATELLRYAREGNAFVTGEPFDDDAVMKLCDACKMALQIDLGSTRNDPDPLEREALNQALGALERLTEGWA